MAQSGTLKYSRVVIFLHHGCTELMRAVISKLVKDSDATETGLTLDGLLQSKRGLLFPRQRGQQNKQNVHFEKILFPGYGKTTDIESWDLQLLAFVAQKLSDDTMLKMDIQQLINIRNAVCHSSKGALFDIVYDSYMERIRVVIRRTMKSLSDEDTINSLCNKFDSLEIESDDALYQISLKRLRNWDQYDHLMKMDDKLDELREGHREVIARLDRIERQRQEESGKGGISDLPKTEVVIGVKNCSKETQDDVCKVLVSLFTAKINDDASVKSELSEECLQKLTQYINESVEELQMNGKELVDARNGCVLLRFRCSSYKDLKDLWTQAIDGTLTKVFKKLQNALQEQYPDIELEVFYTNSEWWRCVNELVANLSKHALIEDVDVIPAEQPAKVSDEPGSSVRSNTTEQSTFPDYTKIHLTIKPTSDDHMKHISDVCTDGTLAKKMEKVSTAFSDELLSDVDVRLLNDDTTESQKGDGAVTTMEESTSTRYSTTGSSPDVRQTVQQPEPTSTQPSHTKMPYKTGDGAVTTMEESTSTRYSRTGSSPGARQTEQQPEPTSTQPSHTKMPYKTDKAATQEIKYSTHTLLSYYLSRILDDTGLSEEAVRLRRQANLKMEKIMQIGHNLRGNNNSIYICGSQMEASTTPGLNSDRDHLLVSNEFNIVQDIKEWKKGKRNLLILQGGDIPAGYCRLQMLRSDRPLPDYLCGPGFIHDSQGRVILENDIHLMPSLLHKSTVHGPAHTVSGHNLKRDIIYSFRCDTMSLQVLPAMERFRNKQWPTAEMLKTARESGFFLVPVGHRLSDTRDMEWRVSPLLTERCLMLGLNNTQLKCYVALKMIKKDIVIPKVEESITSLHLKNVLLHCIESTPPDIWREDNLLPCINKCLDHLLSCVKLRTCTNFLIPGENLFTGRIREVQYPLLQSLIEKLIGSNGRYMFDITTDKVGHRLLIHLGYPYSEVSPVQDTADIIGHCLIDLCQTLHETADSTLCSTFEFANINEFEYIKRIEENVALLRYFQLHPDSIIQEAASDVFPLVCSTYGSLLAARCIREGTDISAKAFTFLKVGFNSDLMSGTLKYASVLYCSGQFEKAVAVLEDLQERYNSGSVQAVCGCNTGRDLCIKRYFRKQVYLCSDSKRRMFIARHVMFVPHEMRCCPPPLYFEMFRGVGNDRSHRQWDMDWMDLAVVDAVVFMHFLLYMAYGKLANRKRQLSSLTSLIVSIEIEGLCLTHLESAYNLLGQCLEMEGQLMASLSLYHRSLQLRPRNNAANWLVALIVYKHYRQLPRTSSRLQQTTVYPPENLSKAICTKTFTQTLKRVPNAPIVEKCW